MRSNSTIGSRHRRVLRSRLPSHGPLASRPETGSERHSEPLSAMCLDPGDRRLGFAALFLSLRSGIRAMTGIHALGVCAQAECESLVPEIESYAAFAASVLTTGQPQLVAIGGLSGVGKARWRGNSRLRSVLPPARFTFEPTSNARSCMASPSPTGCRPKPIRPKAVMKFIGGLFRKAEVALDSGCSVIVDAVFPEAAQRIQLQELAFRTNASSRDFGLMQMKGFSGSGLAEGATMRPMPTPPSSRSS